MSDRRRDGGGQRAAGAPARRGPVPARMTNAMSVDVEDFNKIKHFRRIATRYDKLARNFLAAIAIASIRLWLRHYESTT